MYPWPRTEGPEVNPHSYTHLALDRNVKSYIGKMTVLITVSKETPP